jgi:hypothetical protein
MTILELQHAVSEGYPVRQVINMITDYLQTNPGGGGNTIYTGDGSLSGQRIIDLNGNAIGFINISTGGEFLTIQGDGSQTTIGATFETYGYARTQYSVNDDAQNNSILSEVVDLIGNTHLLMSSNENDGYKFELSANDGSSTVKINADAATNTLSYTADTHSFNTGITITDLAGVGTRALAVDENGKLALL